MAPVRIDLDVKRKSYRSHEREHVILQDFTLSLDSTNRWGIMGPSGAGKTTIFRIIAGLDRDFEGDRILAIDGVKTAPNIGFVFQDRRILPWLTVAQNVALPLLGEGTTQAALAPTAREGRVTELLDSLRLSEKRGAFPSQLSGGQLARVALARALAPKPDILILDEPLSGLDRPARLGLYGLLEGLQRDLGFLQVLVSHQADEIVALCDRVVTLNGNPVGGTSEFAIDLGPLRHWEQPGYYEKVRQLEKGTAE